MKKNKILSIGISEFDSDKFEILPKAKKDASDIYNCMIGLHGYNAIDSKLVINSNYRTLQVELSSFFSKCRPVDFVLIYIATHGKVIRGRKYYMSLTDTLSTGQILKGSALDIDTIIDYLFEVNIINYLIIIDCCRGGSALQTGSVRSRGKEVNSPNVIDEKAGVGKLIISSSDRYENSYEDDKMDNGYFATYLLEAFRKGLTYTNNPKINVYELYDYVYGRFTTGKTSEQIQTPVLSGQDVKGSIYIANNIGYSEEKNPKDVVEVVPKESKKKGQRLFVERRIAKNEKKYNENSFYDWVKYDDQSWIKFVNFTHRLIGIIFILITLFCRVNARRIVNVITLVWIAALVYLFQGNIKNLLFDLSNILISVTWISLPLVIRRIFKFENHNLVESFYYIYKQLRLASNISSTYLEKVADELKYIKGLILDIEVNRDYTFENKILVERTSLWSIRTYIHIYDYCSKIKKDINKARAILELIKNGKDLDHKKQNKYNSLYRVSKLLYGIYVLDRFLTRIDFVQPDLLIKKVVRLTIAEELIVNYIEPDKI